MYGHDSLHFSGFLDIPKTQTYSLAVFLVMKITFGTSCKIVTLCRETLSQIDALIAFCNCILCVSLNNLNAFPALIAKWVNLTFILIYFFTAEGGNIVSDRIIKSLVIQKVEWLQGLVKINQNFWHSKLFKPVNYTKQSPCFKT